MTLVTSYFHTIDMKSHQITSYEIIYLKTEIYKLVNSCNIEVLNTLESNNVYYYE